MTQKASEVIARIEKELRELWITRPGEVPKARACTMNLVVVAGTQALGERYTTILDEVTRSVPARALLVTLEPGALEDSLDGDTTAVCNIGEAAVICSERVRLTAKGSLCGRIASVVDALCVAEMPTTLVWLGRVHVNDPVFANLAREAQRVVLDTEYTSLTSLLQLARWTREEEVRPKIADLAWTRIAVWQEMCARFFDEARLSDLAFHVKRVTITQASEPGVRLGAEGALLLAWMATRLGWKVERMGGTTRFARPDGGSVQLVLRAVARPTEVAPSALARVVVEADHAGTTMTGSMERELASGLEGASPDADVIAWRLETGASRLEQTVRMRANKGARLLERTLHRPPSDAALEESVAFAEEIGEDALVCSGAEI